MILDWFRQHPDSQEQQRESALDEIRSEVRRPCNGMLNLIWPTQVGSTHSLKATIEDVSRSGLALTADAEFEPGQVLLVGRGDAALKKAVVRYCIPHGQGLWRLGAKVIEAENRRAVRSKVLGACEISWMSHSGHSHSAPSTVQDISEFGAQIKTMVALPVNSAVRLEGEQMECIGVVRYSIKRRDHYLAGLHFGRDPYQKRWTAFDWID